MDSRGLKHRAIAKHRKEVARLKEEISVLKDIAKLAEMLDESEILSCLFDTEHTRWQKNLTQLLQQELADVVHEYKQFKFFKANRRRGRGLRRKIERRVRG